MHIQMNMFESTVLKKINLTADSPKKAFYRLELIMYHDGGYAVIKKSGANGKILDTRCWRTETLKKAEKTYNTKLKSKLNKKRKSPRIYHIAA